MRLRPGQAFAGCDLKLRRQRGRGWFAAVVRYGMAVRYSTAGASRIMRHGSRKRGASYPAPVLVGVLEEVSSLCGTPERGVNALGDLFGPKEKDKHC